ncbi:MAG: hypothetical protein WAU02_04185 [Candidatus Saccharimonadales bacterium]
MRAQDWYTQLDVTGKARAEGWACGCPIVQQLIESRGAEAMLQRYSEVNSMHSSVMTEVKRHNPQLFTQMNVPATRLPEELPLLYEDESVPANYKEELPVIGSLVGYAMPRVMLELVSQPNADDTQNSLGAINDAIHSVRDPYELLARISNIAYSRGVTPERIFHHVFIEGWLDEHTATSMMKKAAAAFRDYTPDLFERYVTLTPDEWQAQELHMDFASVIDSRATKANRGEQIDTDEYSISNLWAQVNVRARGGMITSCLLEDPETTETVPILYCDDGKKAKASATHSMSPVGPSNEPGGQHGPWRWADFRQFPSGDSRVLHMQAERSDVAEPTMTRRVMLPSQSELAITSVVHSNRFEQPETTNLGEHVYLACPENDICEVVINGNTLTDVLPEGMLERVLAGEPYHWATAPETLRIGFVDGRTLEMSATARVDDDGNEVKYSVTYLIWHRPGTDSLCIEPVVGYDQERDSRIELASGASLSLETRIQLISSKQQGK